MNIGIIVYSQTGNTLSAAEKIKEGLSGLNHEINIERITSEVEGPTPLENIELENIPEIQKYDVVIFGSPVQAFSLASVMKKYLKQIETLKEKEIVGYVTKGLPFNWTGGTRALRQMKKICRSRGGELLETGIIKWRDSTREENIDKLNNKLNKLFSR